jgi:hypothetical protein
VAEKAWSRRAVLGSALAAAGMPVAAAGAGPAGFPAGIALTRSDYVNWSGEVAQNGLWAWSVAPELDPHRVFSNPFLDRLLD